MNMQRRHSRAAAAVAALAAGGLATYSLWPSQNSTVATLAARNPAAEVRTQVIHRTIHVVRHEPGAGRLSARQATQRGFVQGRGHTSTSASGSHGAASPSGAGGVTTHTSGARAASGTSAGAAGPVSTHSSGSAAVVGSPSGSGAPVTTHSSGSHSSASGSAPASGPVTTHTSGSHRGTSGGSAGGPVTRSSGGGGGDGGDGSDRHSHGD
jgi:hypothetical protein